MTKFRLKSHYDGYWSVQEKSLFFWTDRYSGERFPYYNAKNNLEYLESVDRDHQQTQKEKREYVTRYLYPTLPDKPNDN